MGLKKTISAADFYSYRIMSRDGQINHLLYFRSLFSQFLVDVYAKIETERLNYIRHNQSKLRAENYIHLKDAVGRQDTDPNDLGQMVVLPSSFTGGPRYMHERTQDAMTYVRRFGRPDLFITFTCNPQWEDITKHLLPGQNSHNCHDLIARVFRLKVRKIMDLLTKRKIFGEVCCFMYSVEWQKRGLPHIHILLWLKNSITTDLIDKVISAEIPDPETDPKLYEIVKSNMMHGPCGSFNFKSPCMKQNSCSKRFPKQLIKETQTGEDGYPQYRRRSPEDGGFTVDIKGVCLDNRWVVPYNAVLSRSFGAHINVEYCNSVNSIKYVCKYVNKGTDQATFALENKNDEVTTYENGRYISSSEAVWRIFGFPIHEHFPPVIHLAVHLENGQRIYFNQENIIERFNNPPNTTLLAFFKLCQVDIFAKTLIYSDVPSYYTWHKNSHFERRKRGADVQDWPGIKKENALGRVYTVHPNNAECFYLRMLLHEVKGPTSFEALRTVNGEVHPTFQSACKALGLLEDDQHWYATLQDAALSESPSRIRDLFVILLVFCQVSDPLGLWDKFKDILSEDYKHQVHRNIEDVDNICSEVYNKCLQVLEEAVLSLGGRSLKEYGLPQPTRPLDLGNIMLLRETNYNTDFLERFVKDHKNTLTIEQTEAYDKIMHSVNTNSGQLFFLDAPGGTGKTYLINLILAKIRSSKHIALAVASSGIAATLLEGGRTAHACFKLPLDLTRVETPLCSISKQSHLAEVLKNTKNIIWDEITMAHKRGIEALNRSLQDIRGNKNLMGGVTVLFAEDFRQTLPVVPKGTRADEVQACLKRSILWSSVKSITLTKNMRAYLGSDSTAGIFSTSLLKIGNGEHPTRDGIFDIPEDMCTLVYTIEELIQHIYPGISDIQDKPIEWFCERAILTPKNEQAAFINDILLKSFDGEEKIYKSIDTPCHADDATNYPVEFLNSLKPAGLPYHRLALRKGTPVMLLRNLKPPKLCNGTRLQVKALHKNLVEAVILTGCARGETVFVPRIPLMPNDLPFEFKRLQFPLKVCFAMTINKSQGQTFKVAGVDLREDCFSHGQLYVACSRVSSPSNLFILVNNKKTKNIVYKEIL